MVHIIPYRSAECIDLDCFQQLPSVRYVSVPSVCLEGCWRSLLSSIAAILYCWYNADWQVVLILSSSFLAQGTKKKQKHKPHKQQYAVNNNNNNYNCDCNKKQSHGTWCWCSVLGQSVRYERTCQCHEIYIQTTTPATKTDRQTDKEGETRWWDNR